MVWKGESRRHSLARRGIKTAKPRMNAKGMIDDWKQFNYERNIYLANEEMPIGTVILINGIDYEIRDYFLDEHGVPKVELWELEVEGVGRSVHFAPLDLIWDGFVNYSAISKQDRARYWDKLTNYKHKIPQISMAEGKSFYKDQLDEARKWGRISETEYHEQIRRLKGNPSKFIITFTDKDGNQLNDYFSNLNQAKKKEEMYRKGGYSTKIEEYNKKTKQYRKVN